MECTKAAVAKLTVDTVLFIAFVVSVVLTALVASPVEKGFFCDDHDIQLPYLGNTVGQELVFGLSTGLPIAVIVTLNTLYLYGQAPGPLTQLVLRSSFSIAAVFLQGFFYTFALTEVGRLTVGRLRPHFLATCLPDLSNKVCKVGYVTEFECLNKNATAADVRDARMSFPSGHASYAAYAATFLAVYMSLCKIKRLSTMGRLVVQAFVVTSTLFCGLSGVMDNRHHPSDVLAGFVIGALVALITVAVAGQRTMDVSGLLPDYKALYQDVKNHSDQGKSLIDSNDEEEDEDDFEAKAQ